MGNTGLQAIDHNSSVFAGLVSLAAKRASAGRHRSALQWCRTAAGFATTNPVGILRSPELEQVVDTVASALPAQPSGSPRLPPATGRRVLHVLSEAAPIGGLTRLVERWIQHDAASTSSILLTRQGTVNERLQAAVSASGGATVCLSDNVDAVERAAVLRNLGHEVDLVVCHLQSDDAIAGAAFGRGYCGAPVAFANHGDHIFWLAPTRAQLIVSNRDIAQDLSVQVRGYSAISNQVLPLVVPDRHAQSPRDRIRTDLGVSDDQPLAVSVARAIKFQDTDLRPRFTDLLTAVLDAVPELIFCAVGPEASEEPWPGLRRRYGNRILVTGPVQDPHPYLDAADLYLDTFPFSSTTSLLEASASALAVVTFDGHQGWRKMLGIPTFIGQQADRPTTIEDLAARMAVLARDPDARQDSTRAARGIYEGYYDATQWPALLEQMYERLGRLKDQESTLGESRAPGTDAALSDYNTALWAIEQRTPLLWSIMANLDGFDRRDRVEWAARCLLSRALARAGRSRAAEHALLPAVASASPSALVSSGPLDTVRTGARA